MKQIILLLMLSSIFVSGCSIKPIDKCARETCGNALCNAECNETYNTCAFDCEGPCNNVVCNDMCYDNKILYDGACQTATGSCEYCTQSCQYGCNQTTLNCNSKPVINDTPTDVCPSGKTCYYISNSGNDLNDGKTINTPIKTITKLNSLSLSAGNIVMFKRGDTWRLPTDANINFVSGTSAGYTVYTAYGTGNKPIFLQSYNYSGTGNWTGNGNLWTANVPLDVGNVILNNEKITGIRKINPSEVISQGNWIYNETTNILTLYSISNPGIYYTSIELSVTPQSVTAGAHGSQHMLSKSYITFANISLVYPATCGIRVENSHHINLLDNEIRYGGGDLQNGYDVRFGNCIDIALNSNYINIIGNNVTQCYDGCLTIESWLTAGPKTMTNIEVYNNIFYYCHYPIEFFNSNLTAGRTENISIHHNTLIGGGEWSHNERPDGGADQNRLSRGANIVNFNFTNNIIYAIDGYAVYMGSGSKSNWLGGLQLDYNLYYTPAGFELGYNGSNYYSLNNFRTAWNQESHGQSINPNFNINYKPSGTACTMSSTGSYVGAIPCN